MTHITMDHPASDCFGITLAPNVPWPLTESVGGESSVMRWSFSGC